MPFRYNPPTRTHCEICEKIKDSDLKPIIRSSDGKASNSSKFPFHNWYYFVLGYSPKFPEYIINREEISVKDFVVDPFAGSGTTLVCCKNIGIKSAGIEANNFFKLAADVKLNWGLDANLLKLDYIKIIKSVRRKLSNFKWADNVVNYVQENRPNMLIEKYISNNIFVKVDIIKNIIENFSFSNPKEKDFFLLGLTSILVPVSNVSYGPGFGVGKPKMDVDVLHKFEQKIERMIFDLETKQKMEPIRTPAIINFGDARLMSKFFIKNSVDFMITSPPYPGDHEYTKYSRLELIFLGMAKSLEEFRSIKQRMLRGSTTNIYKSDDEGNLVKNIESIKNVVNSIDRRLKEDGATSGFEKLYTKLIMEYFGGMYKVFDESLKILKPGAKFCLLVSDSHAFKMVHIKTAELLKDVSKKVGFDNANIELWQYKNTTSHRYKLLENILTIQKPE